MSGRQPRHARLIVLAAGVAAVVFPLLGGMSDRTEAVDTPRERITSYVLFYYVADPNNPSPRYQPELLDRADLLADKGTASFWHDGDIPGLQDLVRRLVDQPSDAKTRRFQELVADLLDVRAQKIAMYLIDDVGQPLTNGGRVADRRYDAVTDASGRAVWPSAKDDMALSLTGSRLAGSFSTGEANLSSADDAMSTFIHELTHIQALSDSRPHLFQAGGVDYTYGFDGDHNGLELIPDLATVYDEGVAGAVEMLFDPSLLDEAYAKFVADGALVVEFKAPAARYRNTKILDDVWLYDKIFATGAPAHPTSDPKFAAFTIEDLQPQFLMHNETATALIIAEAVSRTVGPRGLFRALATTNGTLATRPAPGLQANRVSEVELAILLTALGEEILAATGRNTEEALVSGGSPFHLFPLAVFDYVTGMKAASEAEFAALFKGQLGSGWAAAYWTTGRPLVEATLETAPDARRAADIDAIEAVFNQELP